MSLRFGDQAPPLCRRTCWHCTAAVTILTVDAAAMARDGYVFYGSANGVWLTDCRTPRYLRF